MLIDKTLLSRYKIVKKLGKGGFGDTYLAEDIALPGHPYCVVKHLSPKNPNPSIFPIAKKLFDREAKFLYHLGEHDQIPRLYAHFCEEGQFYLVLEFIEGYDLSKEIKPGTKLTEEQTIKVLQEILEVLTVIHRQNVIHRDLKPSNIMRRKEDRKLVLIDFGSVKDLSVSMNTANQKTVGVGSQGYMPPEQSNGHPQLASDIFAVGMIAIQALTGAKPEQLPHDSQNQQILWRSQAKVSEPFADYIDKMVRNNYNDRYLNATEALEALNNIHKVADPPSPNLVNERPVSKGVQLTNPVKYSLAAAAVLLGGLITVIAAGTFQNSSYSQLESYLAAKEWEKADIETDKIMLSKAGQPEHLDQTSIENFDCEALQKIDRLWVDRSGGLFGLSVQKQIYLETGNTLDNYTQEPSQSLDTILQQKTQENQGAQNQNSEVRLGYFPTLSTASPQKPPRHSHSLAHWMVIVRAKACGL